MVRQRKSDLRAELEQLRRDGFVRARFDGTQIDLGEDVDVDRSQPHDLDVVVDRIVVKAGVKGRVTDSIELALKLGDGTVLIDAVDGSEPVVMSERLVSWEHGITLPPLEPRLFSFNSPHGACPVCDGLGMRSGIDAARVVPDPSRTLREGAVAAFGRRGSVATATEVSALVDALGVNPDLPWNELPEEARQAILFGAKGKKKAPAYEGIVVRLERMLETGELEDQEDHDDYEGRRRPRRPRAVLREPDLRGVRRQASAPRGTVGEDRRAFDRRGQHATAEKAEGAPRRALRQRFHGGA